MELWQVEGQRDETAFLALLDRAVEAGCPLTMRKLPRHIALPAALTGQPILLWHDQDDPRARTDALRGGVDDVVGPWMDPDEALARLLRLADRRDASRTMRLGDLAIDLVDHSATRAGRPLGLLEREYALLLHLARHHGELQSRRDLLRAVWRIDFEPGTNVVEVHISRLRSRLDRGFARPMLRTVRGRGYRLQAIDEGVQFAISAMPRTK